MIQDELEHLLELDPIKAHERIMRATHPPPMIIHKEYTGDSRRSLTTATAMITPPFSDEQIDIVAQALADLRIEFRA